MGDLLTDGLEVGLGGIIELLEGNPLGLCLACQAVKVFIHASLGTLAAHLFSGPLCMRSIRAVTFVKEKHIEKIEKKRKKKRAGAAKRWGVHVNIRRIRLFLTKGSHTHKIYIVQRQNSRTGDNKRVSTTELK